jgi:hypothetical protein
MHDRRFVSENFNPDVMQGVPSARQQRAEVIKALFWRQPVGRGHSDGRPAAFSRILVEPDAWRTGLGPPHMMKRTISTARHRTAVVSSDGVLHIVSPQVWAATARRRCNSLIRHRHEGRRHPDPAHPLPPPPLSPPARSSCATADARPWRTRSNNSLPSERYGPTTCGRCSSAGAPHMNGRRMRAPRLAARSAA